MTKQTFFTNYRKDALPRMAFFGSKLLKYHLNVKMDKVLLCKGLKPKFLLQKSKSCSKFVVNFRVC